MVDKQLKSKAIKIKGNSYVLVSDRIKYFNDTYVDGYIQTQLISDPQDDRIVIKAKVVPSHTEPERYFTGYSQAVIGDGVVNKTAALENAETSAVGRALGMMGIGVIDSVASADEMNKAGVTQSESKLTAKCPIHGVAMKHYEKNGREWWSHQLDNGEWCNGKKPRNKKQQPIEEEYDSEELAEDVQF